MWTNFWIHFVGATLIVYLLSVMDFYKGTCYSRTLPLEFKTPAPLGAPWSLWGIKDDFCSFEWLLENANVNLIWHKCDKMEENRKVCHGRGEQGGQGGRNHLREI